MKFDDHISTYWSRPSPERGFDRDDAERRVEHLCFVIVAMVSRGLNALPVARKLRKEIKRAVMGIEQVHRYELKLRMLRSPSWRLKVLKDLGGIDKLIRLWRRLSDVKQQPQRKVKRQKKHLTYEEQRRRAHIQRCAKACAHPNVYRDPFRVDQEGQFRLPPMPRLASKKQVRRVCEYNYDARPVMDFKGLNAPIMVWPDEFLVFMNWEERPKEVKAAKRRFAFVDKWLAAILEEVAEAIPPQPILKTKTARAPPFTIAFQISGRASGLAREHRRVCDYLRLIASIIRV